MRTASFPGRQRRAVVLGSAVILLHWALLEWFTGQLRTPVREAAPEIVAQLLAPRPRPATRAAPPAPAPPRPAHARPKPPPAPPPPDLAAADEPVPAPPADASPVPGADTAGQGQAQGGAADAAASVESEQAGAAGTPAGPAAPATRSYKVDAPPPADITLDVARTDADGTQWSGEAELKWQLDGASYRIDIEAGIRLLFARVNLLTLGSEGEFGEAGFEPVTMTEKRRGRSLTATHFNRQAGTITFSASQESYPLAAGAQDKASVPLQLSAIARGDPGQLAGDIDIQVGEDRDASVYRFEVLGQERIDTPLGRIDTVHLSRPPRPGSYHSRLDIWLAPGRNWYPVQIRNVEASGAVTTQTVNKIVITNTGS